MRLTTKCAMMIVATLLVAWQASAQEILPTPDPAGTPRIEARADTLPPAADPSVDQAANRWRYRWANDHWWYWTPENRWMWYNDEGRWVNYDPTPTPPTIEPRSNVPVYVAPYAAYYPRYYSYGAYYPRYGYWSGYYPGVAVGAAPYGNVGVVVGRRVAVGVAGPYGSVRVGRIYVGW